LLTADLVHVRRRGDLLSVVPLDEDERARAGGLAAAYVDLARTCAERGLDRGALLEACRAVPVASRDQRLAKALLKLVLDRCLFEEETGLEPASLRQTLFLRAAERRRQDEGRGDFDRAALVAAVAAEHSVAPEEIERALFADLPDAHRLRAFDAVTPELLVAGYTAAQVQAVLLRAVKVTATVRAAPAAYRHLFRRLKFLRLLHRIEPFRRAGRPDGYRIEIDGPFALFQSSTKYGLQLALAYPAVAACDEWSLEAELRWGRDLKPLRFQLRGKAAVPAEAEAALPDEVAALLEQLRQSDAPWKAAVSSAVLDLPGVGVCIPDLELIHRSTRQTVYLEVLGFWSREAVWKRVELVERGLAAPMVFAVSKHLRVSEEALGEEHPAALYVYSRTMSARAVLERVEQAAARGRPS
jgi:predicted nuclease of restriction endonuclease-like RecB superfamily